MFLPVHRVSTNPPYRVWVIPRKSQEASRLQSRCVTGPGHTWPREELKQGEMMGISHRVTSPSTEYLLRAARLSLSLISTAVWSPENSSAEFYLSLSKRNPVTQPWRERKETFKNSFTLQFVDVFLRLGIYFSCPIFFLSSILTSEYIQKLEYIATLLK